MSRPAGTPNFVGAKLTQARKLRRKNISTLAEELGLTRSAVSAYEKDSRTPSFEVLEGICRCLDMPVSFFTSSPRQSSDINNGPIFYRSNVSASKMARDAAEVKNEILSDIVDYLGCYVNFPPANVPKFDVPSDPTALDDEEIKRIVEKTRAFWNLSLGPISDLVCLLENHGVTIGKFPFKCEQLDAFSQRRAGQFQVIVGSDKGSCVRQRFDVAHELGHILLHRKVPKGLIKDKAFFDIIEAQAHYFAFEFLFPSQAFKSELGRLSLHEFIRLKLRWKVSIASILQRVSRSDIATPAEIAPLRRAFNRKNWRTEEPFDDSIPCEEPRLLKEAFEIILTSGTQTPKDISEHFNMYFSDIEEIANLPYGYISSFNKGNILELKEQFRNTRSNADDEIIPSKQAESDFQAKVINFSKACNKPS
jgi:Zn-dependent peptidase ImmA (M78 family)/transcriptional regulator with XRE-family HTH domain